MRPGSSACINVSLFVFWKERDHAVATSTKDVEGTEAW